MIVLARRFPSGGLVATWISVGLLIVAEGCSLPTKEDPNKPKDGGAGGTVATGAGGTLGSGGKVGGGGSGGVAVGGKGGAATGTGGAFGTGGAPGSCASSKECTQSALPICSSRTCVACMADGECATRADGKPLCGGAGACVECKDDAACATKTATPWCFKDSGTCVTCLLDDQCKTSAAPACDTAKHTCAACSSSAQCARVNAKLPYCSSTSACVECTMDAQCSGATPICDATTNKCVACKDDGQCKTKSATRPACVTMGTGLGTCVECKTNDQCSGATPGCSAANVCVACTDDMHCPGSAPVCDKVANKCGACTLDSQCKGKTNLPANPGICMGHTDGHCALDVEAVYVEKKTGCVTDASTAGAGSSATPYCSLPPALPALGVIKGLVVVRGAVEGVASSFSATGKVSIVGQNAAAIAGISSPAFQVGGGEVFLRDLKVTATSAIACVATVGATLRMEHVSVVNSSGGGVLLDGAAFDIRNTTVTGNGPGDDAGAAWGGLRIKSPPVAGPTRLERVTVQGNQGPGISCSAALATTSTTGVLATANPVSDISATCGFTSCGTASATCGSSP